MSPWYDSLFEHVETEHKELRGKKSTALLSNNKALPLWRAVMYTREAKGKGTQVLDSI